MHKNYLVLVLFLLSVQDTFTARTKDEKRIMAVYTLDTPKRPEGEEGLSQEDILRRRCLMRKKRKEDRERMKLALQVAAQSAQLENGSGENSMMSGSGSQDEECVGHGSQAIPVVAGPSSHSRGHLGWECEIPSDNRAQIESNLPSIGTDRRQNAHFELVPWDGP